MAFTDVAKARLTSIFSSLVKGSFRGSSCTGGALSFRGDSCDNGAWSFRGEPSLRGFIFRRNSAEFFLGAVAKGCGIFLPPDPALGLVNSGFKRSARLAGLSFFGPSFRLIASFDVASGDAGLLLDSCSFCESFSSINLNGDTYS